MTEDRRAHERLGKVETQMEKHLADHAKFEQAIAENTAMTKEIAADTKTLAANTTELVTIVKGAKSLRSFVIWAAPVAAALAACYAFFKDVK